MVVLDNVVIFTKFFLEFILSTGIAFVFFTVLVAVVLDMVVKYYEAKKEDCEIKKEKRESINENKKNENEKE